jgi:hypothetical protein
MKIHTISSNMSADTRPGCYTGNWMKIHTQLWKTCRLHTLSSLGTCRWHTLSTGRLDTGNWMKIHAHLLKNADKTSSAFETHADTCSSQHRKLNGSLETCRQHTLSSWGTCRHTHTLSSLHGGLNEDTHHLLKHVSSWGTSCSGQSTLMQSATVCVSVLCQHCVLPFFFQHMKFTHRLENSRAQLHHKRHASCNTHASTCLYRFEYVYLHATFKCAKN